MIPTWKKWLSHITPMSLEQTGSEHNPNLEVAIHKGRLQLLSDNAIYSWDDLYDNFRKAFEHLNIKDQQLKEVLVLGLGLGSIPLMLEKTFHQKDCYFTAIEIDEKVSELAVKYTLSRMSNPVQIITTDAYMFMEITEEKFDMIAVDIFEDDLVPPDFETQDFLELCKEALAPGGILLFNRLTQKPHDLKSTERFYNQTFSDVFPHATYLDTGGNWVLIAREGA